MPSTTLRNPAASAARVRLPADVRVQQILDAALAEFSARGYAGTRMDDIAGRAALSKGGLYAHFDSKDQIFEALLQRSLAPPVPNGSLLHKRGACAREVVEHIVETLYATLAQPSATATLRLLLCESGRVPHLGALWQRNVVQPYLEQIAQLLQHSVAQGILKPSVVASQPWLIASPTVYAIMSQLVLGDIEPARLEDLRQGHVALLCELLTPT